MAGCKLVTGVPVDGKLLELKDLVAGALALVVLLDLDAEDLEAEDLALDALALRVGAEIMLIAFGVGLVVHCHSPSADTHA